MDIETKRTLKDWSSLYEVEILDPDGFDRNDPYLYTRTFTEQEFNDGLIRSTIIATGGNNHER